jgi:uncharacterized protein
VRCSAALRGVTRLPQLVLLTLVKGYRLFFKAWLGNSCRFEPTCSAYALTALERHGAARGSALTVSRLLRCHPWCAGGHDPVPPLAAGLFSRLGLTRPDPDTTSTRKLT